ncbi:Uncharacterized membrane protein YbhN, UPF0104 family [Streptoalloteichus hindustanus]|uniref:Uncharacterized membrane protein YbhN, UPF0104 family n=2 Tax=Streptoalloteichus hindustanus TaxID=2017 RepID=A0A1M5GE73_STRHI|nr:Uncharacterized membrane protein YbhN, UPF0104 family [Streptoalloteichus hindustanus]
MRWVRITATIASFGLSVALIAFALPKVAGVSWESIGDQFSAVSGPMVLWLVALWLAGLWAYTYVLTGSLPGLTNTQALTMNAVGSAVSNLLPFGGAFGVAVTFAMAGTWGHRRRAIAISTVVSGVWNMLSRLALPAVGLAALMVSGHLPDERLTVAAGVAVGTLVVVLAVLVAVLVSDAASRRISALLERCARGLPKRWRPAPGRIGDALHKLRHDTVDLMRTAWLQLSVGMVVYMALQGVLFWWCLEATNAVVAFGPAVAAFALGRLLTTAVITPSGVGVSENGTVALLVAFGSAPGPVAAAVLLFSFFTYAVEIPFGGLAWLAWLGSRRRAQVAAAQN